MDVRRRNMLTVEDLHAIFVPTLLVWTTADPVAGLDVGHWCNGHISDSELVIFENSGHWPQFEEPDRFNEIHTEFLSRGAPLEPVTGASAGPQDALET